MHGRLFQPGVEGVTVEATVGGNDLAIAGPGVSLRWPLDGVSASMGGTGQGHLVLAPRATPGAELYLERAGLVAALEEQVAPPWFVEQVRGLSAASGRRWALSRTVALIVLVALVAGAGLLLLGARRLVLAAVPASWEEAVGQTVWEEHRATVTLADDPALQVFVEETARRLLATQPERPPYEFSFHVARDAEVNAFAFPGGVVLVNTGLIAAARTPDEVAGALAHELSHVLGRHSLQVALDQVGVLAAMGLLVGSHTSLLELQAALSLTSSKFSRDNEREADALGLLMLHEAGLDPTAMGSLYERLAEEEHELRGPVGRALLASHPRAADRAAALADRAEALPPRPRQELVSSARWAALQAAARGE